MVTVTTLTRELSDHTPLLISTGEVLKIPRQFKIENCWLLRLGLEEIVTKIWGQSFRENNVEMWQKAES